MSECVHVCVKEGLIEGGMAWGTRDEWGYCCGSSQNSDFFVFQLIFKKYLKTGLSLTSEDASSMGTSALTSAILFGWLQLLVSGLQWIATDNHAFRRGCNKKGGRNGRGYYEFAVTCTLSENGLSVCMTPVPGETIALVWISGARIRRWIKRYGRYEKGYVGTTPSAERRYRHRTTVP
jgi:hypothetical protein